jgi:hypothetical protein
VHTASLIAKKSKGGLIATTNQTLTPSTLPKNDALSDLDYYEIIWFNSDPENPVKLDRLRTISDCVKFFDNIDNCREYIETVVSDRSTIFLVTSGHAAEKLVPVVYNLNQIRSIHCLTKDVPEKEWMSKDPKVSLKDTFYFTLFFLDKSSHYSSIAVKISIKRCSSLFRKS